MRAWGIGLCVLVLSGLVTVEAIGRPEKATRAARIVLLHHSTGQCILDGGVAGWIEAWNRQKGTKHRIQEQAFPKSEPYGWENYPYDYYNIWVKHAGARPYRQEPTLEMLTPRYDVVVFKHCFPVSNIEADTGHPDVDSPDKRIENYKLQYEALKRKLTSFKDTKFLVWTGAALVRGETNPASGRRARAFFDWVKTTWDEKGDNIFVWDFFELETEGDLYLKRAYADGDSHPNDTFSRRVAPYLGQRIVDVAEGRGDATDITGRHAAPAAPLEAEPTDENEPEPDPPAPETEPAKPAEALPTGVERWVFDDAEKADGIEARWGAQAQRVKEGDGHHLKLDFTKGRAEDWGEYGPHRIIETRLGRADHDLSGHRFLALRVKSDRDVLVPLALLTRSRTAEGAGPAHYGFTAYLHLKPGPWRWLVFDVSTLELEVEGPSLYEAAGRPTRPKALSSVRLSIHGDHVKATILLDDLVFLKTLPEALKPHVQHP